MTFFFGFMCGIVLGVVVTHLTHTYIDTMLPQDTEKPEPPLWLGKKDDEGNK